MLLPWAAHRPARVCSAEGLPWDTEGLRLRCRALEVMLTQGLWAALEPAGGVQGWVGVGRAPLPPQQPRVPASPLPIQTGWDKTQPKPNTPKTLRRVPGIFLRPPGAVISPSQPVTRGRAGRCPCEDCPRRGGSGPNAPDPGDRLGSLRPQLGRWRWPCCRSPGLTHSLGCWGSGPGRAQGCCAARARAHRPPLARALGPAPAPLARPVHPASAATRCFTPGRWPLRGGRLGTRPCPGSRRRTGRPPPAAPATPARGRNWMSPRKLQAEQRVERRPTAPTMQQLSPRRCPGPGAGRCSVAAGACPDPSVAAARPALRPARGRSSCSPATLRLGPGSCPAPLPLRRQAAAPANWPSGMCRTHATPGGCIGARWQGRVARGSRDPSPQEPLLIERSCLHLLGRARRPPRFVLSAPRPFRLLPRLRVCGPLSPGIQGRPGGSRGGCALRPQLGGCPLSGGDRASGRGASLAPWGAAVSSAAPSGSTCPWEPLGRAPGVASALA